MHGARFSIKAGEVLSALAFEPVRFLCASRDDHVRVAAIFGIERTRGAGEVRAGPSRACPPGACKMSLILPPARIALSGAIAEIPAGGWRARRV